MTRFYPGVEGERHVLYRLPMVRGWAYYAWAVENDGWLSFSGMRRDSPGYQGQEIKSLLDIQRKYDLTVSQSH